MPFHGIGAEQLMALEQPSEIFQRATNTSKDTTSTPYTVPPVNIPERIKTVDITPSLRVQINKPTTVNTTPPPRVQKNEPNIIPPNDTNAPSPRVQPCRSPCQHQGPHIIPQCNMAQHHYLSSIPPYFVNA
eukprot:5680970-Ditylum_brightwellii.AAC.1